MGKFTLRTSVLVNNEGAIKILIMGKFYTTSLLASNRGANSCKIFSDSNITSRGKNCTLHEQMFLASTWCKTFPYNFTR